jgi:hypothetical protein
MAIKSQILISDTNVKLIELISTIYNVMLLAFYRAIDQSKTIFNLVNGFMDEYEDESGIDTVNSTGEEYNSTNDYYTNTTSLDAYTKLLLHGDGDNGSQTFTDECGKTITPVGNAQISTSQKKFGNSSIKFDGTGDYLSIPDSTDWDIIGNTSDDYTIELWFYLTTINKTNAIWHQHVDGDHQLFIDITPSNKIEVYFSNGSWIGINTGSVGVDQWYHLALVKEGGVSDYDLKLYLDGTLIGSSLNNTLTAALSAPLYIGQYVTYHFSGYMDEIRVSKSVARWTSNFTPSTSPYGSAENFVLISNSVTADTTPSSARIVLFEEDVDAITLNTDLKAYVSRDGGTTYTQVTLENEGYYAVSKNILAGLADISGQPSGTSMKYKIETLNNKTLKLHGAGVNWA